MSKAYCCDICEELYCGEPAMVDNEGNDLCPKCVKIMEIFSKIDPFTGKFNATTNETK